MDSSRKISIIDALQSDLPEMVALRGEAAEADLSTRFRFSHRHIEAAQMEAASLMISLGKRFTEPTNRCHIVKAIDTDSDELVGWGLVRWEDGSWVYKNMPPELKPSEPRTFNALYLRGVKENWQKILAGKPHVGMSMVPKLSVV
jgi:hypothetical protein